MIIAMIISAAGPLSARCVGSDWSNMSLITAEGSRPDHEIDSRAREEEDERGRGGGRSRRKKRKMERRRSRKKRRRGKGRGGETGIRGVRLPWWEL